MDRLWTPWRSSYVTGAAKGADCVFCDRAQADHSDELIVHHGERCYVIMNLYPYNTGHTMIVPRRHVAELTELTADEHQELFELLPAVLAALKGLLRPEGFNVGLNLGVAAGAGIADHLHLHLVPRWIGDTNFMPIVGATKVLPELIPDTAARLRPVIAQVLGRGTTTPDSTTPAPSTMITAAPPPAPSTMITAPPAPEPSSPPISSTVDLSDPTPVSAPAAATADETPAEPRPPALITMAAPPPGERLSSIAWSTAPPAPQPALRAGTAPPDSTLDALPPAGASVAPALSVAASAPDDAADAPNIDAASLPIVDQAGAVVLLRGKVVLRKTTDGSWVLPKGHLEAGETHQQAAIREVAEELGLAGEIGPLAGEMSFVYKRTQRQVQIFLFRANRPLVDWPHHLGTDAFLFSPEDATRRLTHASARSILEQALALDREWRS